MGWVQVDEIEISCFYVLYGVNDHKSSVWEKMKQCERNVMFQKTRAFILFK